MKRYLIPVNKDVCKILVVLDAKVDRHKNPLEN